MCEESALCMKFFWHSFQLLRGRHSFSKRTRPSNFFLELHCLPVSPFFRRFLSPILGSVFPIIILRHSANSLIAAIGKWCGRHFSTVCRERRFFLCGLSQCFSSLASRT